MLAAGTLALYLGAAVALILVPGQDTLFVLGRGLAAGPRVGARAAAGVATGVLVHTAGAVVGLAALYRTVPGARQAVALAGAGVLVVLAADTLRHDRLDARADGGAGGEGGPDSPEGFDGGRWAGYRAGVAVNVLNPKVALFFLAFLPQFGSTAAELAVLGGLYALVTLAYLGVVGALAGRVRAVVERPGVARGLRGLSALVLVGLAARLVVG